MSKIRMVIADTDEEYIEGFTGFLLSNYSQQFRINAFTKKEYLREYLSKNENKVDLLMVCPDFIESKDLLESGTVIVLYEGKHNSKFNGCECVNKYQHGDILVSSILDILSGDKEAERFKISTSKATKIISVYSPVGGSGKTSIATSICIQCSKRGFKTFYLNLEKVQTTRGFFKGSSEYNMSHVFFYLKDGECDLGMKLEGLKNIDTTYNVHYFKPSETILEIDEMLPEDYGRLINGFRQTGSFDLVVVDMDTSFDKRAVTLLNTSDEILLVSNEDYTSEIKIKAFQKQLQLLSSNENININDKIRVIVNKHKTHPKNYGPFQVFPEIAVSLKLPFVGEEDGKTFNSVGDNEFTRGLYHWTSRYVR